MGQDVILQILLLIYLKNNVHELLEPKNWPPKIPDLNPVDYAIWGILEQKVYRKQIRNIEHLKMVIEEEWNKISQNEINKAIEEFRI